MYGAVPFQPLPGQFDVTLLNYQPQFNSHQHTLCITGNAYTIAESANQICSEGKHVKSVRISITGNLIQSYNYCRLIWTIILGSILILPLFLLCCNCWRKSIAALYEVTADGYAGMASILRSVRPKSVSIMVQDNYFNKDKAKIIIEAVRHSGVHYVEFINAVGKINTEGKNYKEFKQYMGPILDATEGAHVSWGSQILNKGNRNH